MSSVKCYDKYGQQIDHLTQWDINVSLKIFDFPFDIAPVCHFAGRFDKTAKTVTTTLDSGVVSVQVPNILLTENKPIKMFVFLYDSEEDTGRTIYVVDLTVEAKPKPDDYEYSDNIEIIEITALKARLEALIAQAEEMVDTRISDLDNSYQNTIIEIRQAISDDVDNLNRQITNANTALINEIRENKQQLTSEIQSNNTQLTSDISNARTQLTLDISNARTQLNNDVQSALTRLINGIRDGSPRGVFGDIADLSDSPEGIYLYINPESENNGYIYYWDGTTLSDRLLYYSALIINDGTITLEKLSNTLKEQCMGKTISYVLLSANWENSIQEIDLSEYYTVTEHTRVDVEFGHETYEQLRRDDCAGIYVVNNENDDDKVLVHHIGNQPTEDITVQLTIKETY